LKLETSPTSRYTPAVLCLCVFLCLCLFLFRLASTIDIDIDATTRSGWFIDLESTRSHGCQGNYNYVYGQDQFYHFVEFERFHCYVITPTHYVTVLAVCTINSYL